MAQQGYGPPSLPVGTEVSAKYRGAFCEATVKSVVRVVKCKVVMKDCQSSVFVTDDEIKGMLKLASVVEVKHPDTGQPVEATINKLMDHSTYTVVFDDGDERTLRRTQLCLKGDKHFIESETLDNLPLSHPEHFGTPVLQNKKARRRNGDESEEDEEDEDEDSESESPRRAMYRGRHQELVGKLMLVDIPHRKGCVMPALVVLPDANSLNEVKGRDQILLRSFKDSKFIIINRKELKEFQRSVAIKNEDKTMRLAFEKALLYFDTKELPVGWNKSEMLGSDIEEDDEDNGDDEYASEDEPFEEKDRFVAQLYKFMDDRGTPINKGPCIGNKDLNLYKLFKIVQNLGGYNKVTKEMKWPVVYSKMGLPSLHQNPAHQIKTAYKKYLDAYETFFRKLGSTMGTLSRPGRARQNSGRNILSFRARERSPRSPKPPEKSKDETPENTKSKVSTPAPSEKVDDPVDSSSVTSTEETDVVTRRTPRREARAPLNREESKERKEEVAVKPKKEEKKEEPAAKAKKEEVVVPSKVKKEKDEASSLGQKGKKNETAVKSKKEEETVKKEERKSARKAKVAEEGKDSAEKEDKKPVRIAKKEEEKVEEPPEESTPTPPESPKKRITRRKLLVPEPPKEPAPKVEEEPAKKAVVRDQKPVEKKEKEIPRTLERRDSRAAAEKKEAEKKEAVVKPVEKKEAAPVEKKVKASEEKKKKEKKAKDDAEGGSDDTADEKDGESDKPDPKVNFPIGSKLRVKYGKGKNQKIYVAKVVDFGRDAGHKTYRVHYAGWNSRYDEWIRPDRVVSVLDRPETSKLAKLTTVPKQAPGVSSVAKKVKTPPKTTKPQDIFRTPKLISSKTRATRSSSTENLAASDSKKTGTRKRMTRRGSSVADSTGSRSPESQVSSDAEENVESVEDDESTKGDKEEDGDDDVLEVEDEDKLRAEAAAAEACEKPGVDNEDDENATKESSVFELGPEKADYDDDTEEDDEKATDKPKEWSKSEDVVDAGCSTSEEITTESVESTTHEVVAKQEEEASPKAKAGGRPVVSVTEVDHAVDEIKSAVSITDTKDSTTSQEKLEVQEAFVDIKPEVSSNDKEAPPVTPESETTEKMVPEHPKKEAELEADCKSDASSSAPAISKVEPEEDREAPVLVANQSIPHLQKEVLDSVVAEKVEDRPAPKAGRGRKKDSAKEGQKKSIRTLDMSGTSMASATSEIPMLEPMGPAGPPPSDSARQQKEPSPYDFDDDAAESSAWKPEITKKWEPSVLPTNAAASVDTADQKAPKVAGPEEVGEDEKEKKKVKKKAKKKPISPEFVVEAKAEEVGPVLEQQPALPKAMETVGATEETPASDGDAGTTEKVGLRKKGRKKKETGVVEAKREVIDQYENTVNSVVEAVKHSLQEADSDHEQRPPIRRRRPKRVSESDSKDVVRSAKFMRKLGVGRKTPKSIETVPDVKDKLEDGSQSPVVQESASATSGVSMSVSQAEEESPAMNRTSGREPSLRDSQGFEPQSEPQQDGGAAAYDNTPPTTPEHDEGSDNPPCKQLDEGEAPSFSSQHHPATSSSSLSEPSHHQHNKDTVSKVACSSASATSSLVALSAASGTTIASHVQSSSSGAKSSSESPSDNDVVSTASTDNLESGPATQQSEGSGTDQDLQDPPPSSASASKKRKQTSEAPSPGIDAQPKKKKRVHGTRSRTARKSPKYANSDSQGSASNTPNHYPPESPPTKFVDLSKSPRPSKYNFNADLGEYLEGEARCNFLITKMKEIKTIYMSLKSEVATIDRRRKRARRKERDGPQVSTEKECST